MMPRQPGKVTLGYRYECQACDCGGTAPEVYLAKCWFCGSTGETLKFTLYSRGGMQTVMFSEGDE